MIECDPELGFVEIEDADFVRFPYKKPGRWWDVGKYERRGTKRKKSTKRVFDVIKPDVIPGERAFWSMREQHVAQFRNKPGFPSWVRTKIPDGMNRAEAEAAWKIAKEQAKTDLAVLLEYWRKQQKK